MNLESTAAALREWTPAENADLERQERRLEKFGNFAFGGFGLVVLVGVLGLIYMLFTRAVLGGTADQPLMGIVLIIFLVFAFLTLAYVILRESLKDKRKKARPAVPNELAGPAVTGKLLEEREFEPIPTVTEDTTTLLPVRERER